LPPGFRRPSTVARVHWRNRLAFGGIALPPLFSRTTVFVSKKVTSFEHFEGQVMQNKRDKRRACIDSTQMTPLWLRHHTQGRRCLRSRSDVALAPMIPLDFGVNKTSRIGTCNVGEWGVIAARPSMFASNS